MKTYVVLLILILGGIISTEVAYATVTSFTDNVLIQPGSLGVGNTNPQTSLSIGSLNPGNGEASVPGSVQIATSGGLTSSAGGLEFKTSSYQSGFGWRITAPDTFGSGTPLTIQQRVNSPTWTEVVRIANTGNIGVGNTNPGEKLDVTGNIRLTGNIVSPNDICIGTC